VWAVYARGEILDKRKVETFKRVQQIECESRWDLKEVVITTASQQATPVGCASAMMNYKVHSELAKEYIRVGATPHCIRATGMGMGMGTGTGTGTGTGKGIVSTGTGIVSTGIGACTLCNPMMFEGPQQVGVICQYFIFIELHKTRIFIYIPIWMDKIWTFNLAYVYADWSFL
jgi:hypothetical protein